MSATVRKAGVSLRGIVTLTVLIVLGIGLAIYWFYFVYQSKQPRNIVVPQDAAAAALTSQLDLAQRDMDRLIGLVGAAMGVIVTIAAVLVAVNLFASQWAYERDRATIREELLETLKDTISAEQSRLQEGLSSLQSAFEARMSGDIDQKSDELKSMINQVMYIAALSGVTNMLHLGDVPNAVGTINGAFGISIEMKDYNNIQACLQKLTTTFQQHSVRLDSGLAAQITANLNQAPPEFTADVTILRRLVQDARERFGEA